MKHASAGWGSDATGAGHHGEQWHKHSNLTTIEVHTPSPHSPLPPSPQMTFINKQVTNVTKKRHGTGHRFTSTLWTSRGVGVGWGGWGVRT